MRSSRSLSLKREALTELTTDELTGVAAGQALTHTTCNITDTCGHGRSFDEPCPTFPINPCLSLGEYVCINIE